MRRLPNYSMKGDESILSPEDCGMINGKITFNGWLRDVASIRGIYAPPLFSNNFSLNVRFDGRSVRCEENCWAPDVLERKGGIGDFRITTRLFPVGGRRAIVMVVVVKNLSAQTQELPVQFEVTGGLGHTRQWGFAKPGGAPAAIVKWNKNILSLNEAEGQGRLLFTSTLGMRPLLPVRSGVLDAKPLRLLAKEETRFYLFLTIAPTGKEAQGIFQELRNAPEECCRNSRAFWERRVKRLYERMPSLTSDNPIWQKLYDRSLLHLLLNEWDVQEFLLHPYYSTGGINGGCVGCYLWNYGEPYRLWSILDPKSAREHLLTWLRLDLSDCFGFNPDDGAPFGPCYPVNHEKVIFLTYAYVMQTRDLDFLQEKCAGRTVLEHMFQQALMYDDLSQKAVLVDYGTGNHHLELRRSLRYDGILPDMNLRRCVGFHLVNELFRVAGKKPPVNLLQRAKDLKALIRRKLYDAHLGWYVALDQKGNRTIRYTIQMFKALGWGDWTMGETERKALLKHLMDPWEFRGQYGLHSLSKLDEAYDEFDIDNGGPGACVSFAPAVIDRLYQDGEVQSAETILKSLTWLAESLPYWGDSQRADIREYRRDTPLQNDIQGAAIAQTMIFGMFGVHICEDFSIEVNPHIPEGTEQIRLDNLRLAGRCLSVEASRKGGTIVHDGGDAWQVPFGKAIVIPPK